MKTTLPARTTFVRSTSLNSPAPAARRVGPVRALESAYADLCICGARKNGGRLCSGCFESAPLHVIEGFLRGARSQRSAAERWLVAHGKSRRTELLRRAVAPPPPIHVSGFLEVNDRLEFAGAR